jgi:hypothetical protein
MEEAPRADVERIVTTSSVATIKLREGAPGDESRLLAEDSGCRPSSSRAGRECSMNSASPLKDGRPDDDVCVSAFVL